MAVALLALLGLTVSACAVGNLPDRGTVVMRDVRFSLRDFHLPSGLRVSVEQDPRSPVVAVVAVVGVGGSGDPVGKEGLAHLVEHLTFRARHEGLPTVWTRLEQAGAGRFNAFTRLDHTEYQTLAPRESLPALLRLEAQQLAAPLDGVTEEVFAVEREVVRSELRQRNETGFVGQIFQWIQEAALPAGHPYSRPVIGTHDSLSRLTLEDARRFASEHYRPENVTLLISGDVDLMAVDALLKESLSEPWHGSGPPRALASRLSRPAPEPPLSPRSKQLVTHEAAVPTPELYLTWVLPRGYDEGSILNELMRARLAGVLRDSMVHDGDIADLETALIPGTQASLLVVRAVLNTGRHPERSAEAVLDTVSGTWTGLGLDGMRLGTIVGMALEAEDTLARAALRAELTHFTQDVRAYGRGQGAVLALTQTQVGGFAERYLRRQRARVFLVRPGEHGVPALDAAARVPPDEVPLEGPRGPPPAALSRPSPVTSLRLDNGMEVLLVPHPGLPLVSIGVALGGGEVSGRRGVAELANWVAIRTSNLQGQAGDFGLRHSRTLYQDHLRYWMAGASGNLGNMLAILEEQLSHMGTEFSILRFYDDNRLVWRKALDDYPEVRARRALLRALYGAHPYGQAATGEDIEKLGESDVEGWLSATHRPANAVAVIAGDFDPREVVPLVRRYLGAWSDKGPATEAPPLPPLPGATAKPVLLVTPRPGATQGHVQWACRLEGATPEAAARHALMAEVLNAFMWRRVREQLGATYGFHAQVSLARGGATHLMMEGIVDVARLGASMKFAHEALTSYAREGISAAELDRARSRLLAAYAVSLDTSGSWVDALLSARMLDWNATAVTDRPALLRAVTAEALQKEFASCGERLVVGVTGDEAAARAAAQAAFP